MHLSCSCLPALIILVFGLEYKSGGKKTLTNQRCLFNVMSTVSIYSLSEIKGMEQRTSTNWKPTTRHEFERHDSRDKDRVQWKTLSRCIMGSAGFTILGTHSQDISASVAWKIINNAEKNHISQLCSVHCLCRVQTACSVSRSGALLAQFYRTTWMV